MDSFPDQDLFREIMGAWNMLRTKDDRRAFVEHARRFVHEYTTPQTLRVKKARR